MFNNSDLIKYFLSYLVNFATISSSTITFVQWNWIPMNDILNFFCVSEVSFDLISFADL